jgi:hypothetical protein
MLQGIMREIISGWVTCRPMSVSGRKSLPDNGLAIDF